MAKELDFHQVSENESVIVYEAMEKLNTEPNEDGTEVRKYGTVNVKKVENIDAILEAFAGYDVESITVSKQSGIKVVVNRPKDQPYVEAEPNVKRLERKGGDK